MPTTTPPADRRKRPLLFWFTPALSLVLGVAMGGAAWVGGQPRFGAFALGLMVALAIVLVLAARRSETVTGLLDHRDERISAIDRDASLVAGHILTLAVILAFVRQLAVGADPMPYAWLGALAGGSYLVALLVLRVRR